MVVQSALRLIHSRSNWSHTTKVRGTVATWLASSSLNPFCHRAEKPSFYLLIRLSFMSEHLRANYYTIMPLIFKPHSNNDTTRWSFYRIAKIYRLNDWQIVFHDCMIGTLIELMWIHGIKLKMCKSYLHNPAYDKTREILIKKSERESTSPLPTFLNFLFFVQACQIKSWILQQILFFLKYFYISRYYLIQNMHD